MAKRRKAQAKGELVDEILTQWRSKLLKSIRSYLLETDESDHLDGLCPILTTPDGCYFVDFEWLYSDDIDAARVRRTASAIEAIDAVQRGGCPATTLDAVFLGWRMVELNETHLIQKAKSQIEGALAGLEIARKTREQQWAPLRVECEIRMQAEMPKHKTKRDAAKEVLKAFCHLQRKPSIRFIEKWSAPAPRKRASRKRK